MTSATLLAPRPVDLAVVPRPAARPAAGLLPAVAPRDGQRAVLGLHGPSDTSSTVLSSVLLATG